MSIQNEKSVAIIYDLLSQTERLDATQLPLLQEHLNQLGFDAGAVDGIIAAIRLLLLQAFLKTVNISLSRRKSVKVCGRTLCNMVRAEPSHICNCKPPCRQKTLKPRLVK